MSTETLSNQLRPAQHTAAKVVGVLYVVQMALAILAESFLRGQIIVAGNAMQTAANITASERLFRLSLANDLVLYASVIVLVCGLYVILKPINSTLALLAAFLRLVENAILSVSILGAFAALAFLSGADYLRAFDSGQLQAMVQTALRVYGGGFKIGFVFLGFGSTVFSYLWLKSRYIPRVLAAWGIFSSLVLSIVTVIIIVFPSVGSALGLTYMAPMFFYEVGLGLWLLIKGLRTSASGV